MDLKDKIKDILQENLDEAVPKNPVAEFKKQRAKVLGLSHTAFDTYKNKSGDIFVWDRSKRDFRSTNVINDKVKDFVKSKEVNKFKDTFFDFILKNKIDVSKNKTDDLLNKYLVRRFNGESVDHLRDFFFQSMNEISDKKFNKNDFNYEHNDLNQLLLQIGSLVKSHKTNLGESMSIKDKIREKLDEAVHYFDDARDLLRNQKARVMNLKHVGHGTYKNPAGHDFIWDDASNNFKPIKGVTPSNIVQFPDLSQKGGRSRGDHPDNPTTPEDDEQINKHYKQQQTINKDKRDSEPKPSKEDPNKDLGFDPWTLLKKQEPKSMFNNPPPGGWTDADKVPQSVNDKIKKSNEYRKQNADSLKSQNVYNMKKGDTFKQIVYGYYDDDFGKERDWKIDKIINLKVTKNIHASSGSHIGRFTVFNPTFGVNSVEKNVSPTVNPNAEEEKSKIKDTIKAKLQDPKEDYEVEDVSEDPNDHRNGKLISDNWGLQYTGHDQVTFRVYENPENIGRRGKTVKKTTLYMYIHHTNSKTAWGPTIYDRIKEAKPKTAKDLIDFIEGQFKDAKSEEPNITVYPTREYTYKGIDREIPDFGLEGKFEDFSGTDINVEYKKPTISIKSKKRMASDKDYYNSGIDVKWNYAKKLKKIETELKAAKDESEIIKLFNDNGIKYKSYMYSRWD